MCHRIMTVARIDKPLAPLDYRHQDSARWPSNVLPWRRDHYFGQFWKLGFRSVSECEIFAQRGQICILLNYEGVASVRT